MEEEEFDFDDEHPPRPATSVHAACPLLLDSDSSFVSSCGAGDTDLHKYGMVYLQEHSGCLLGIAYYKVSFFYLLHVCVYVCVCVCVCSHVQACMYVGLMVK